MDKSRTFHPTLGQVTSADWYLRATKASGRFDDLLARTGRIADQAEREKILNWIGVAAISGTPAYKYAALKNDMDVNVNNFTPPNVAAYEVDGRRDLVTTLEAVDNDFESLVSVGEVNYGVLAQPVVIDRDKIIGQINSSKWTLPIIVGVAAIGVAAVISMLAGKNL